MTIPELSVSWGGCDRRYRADSMTLQITRKTTTPVSKTSEGKNITNLNPVTVTLLITRASRCGGGERGACLVDSSRATPGVIDQFTKFNCTYLLGYCARSAPRGAPLAPYKAHPAPTPRCRPRAATVRLPSPQLNNYRMLTLNRRSPVCLTMLTSKHGLASAHLVPGLFEGCGGRIVKNDSSWSQFLGVDPEPQISCLLDNGNIQTWTDKRPLGPRSALVVRRAVWEKQFFMESVPWCSP
ncbi:hypothetical protein J6590_066305 [Homalodisca vitripennis]|nr:hypothetical protein J6590_066305 [Homalodisca vitripennis]